MKIEKITKITSEIIETDEEESPTLSRSNDGLWSRLMGESWEPIYFSKEYELLYQESIKKHKIVKFKSDSDQSDQIPEWVSKEIKETWRAASGQGQATAYRIIEAMVDRLGYGRLNVSKGY